MVQGPIWRAMIPLSRIVYTSLFRCHSPRRRGIQYSAAVVGALNGRHGVLNHPLSRVMTPVDAASPPLEAQLAAALWLDGYAPNTLANPA